MSAFSNVTVLDHPLVQHKLTLLRRKETATSEFRRLMRELSLLMAYEVTRDLRTETVAIETPLETTEAPLLSSSTSWCRAGESRRAPRSAAARGPAQASGALASLSG